MVGQADSRPRDVGIYGFYVGMGINPSYYTAEQLNLTEKQRGHLEGLFCSDVLDLLEEFLPEWWKDEKWPERIKLASCFRTPVPAHVLDKPVNDHKVIRTRFVLTLRGMPTGTLMLLAVRKDSSNNLSVFMNGVDDPSKRMSRDNLECLYAYDCELRFDMFKYLRQYMAFLQTTKQTSNNAIPTDAYSMKEALKAWRTKGTPSVKRPLRRNSELQPENPRSILAARTLRPKVAIHNLRP